MNSARIVLSGVLLCILACSKQSASSQGDGAKVIEERVLLELKDGVALSLSTPIPDDGQALHVSSVTGNLACILKREGQPGAFVYWNGKESQCFDELDSLEWSPDGKHLAYVYKRGLEETLGVDLGETAVTAKSLSTPVWSPDSSSVVVGAAHGDADLWEEYYLGDNVVRVPGKAGKHPSFSPTGKLSFSYMDKDYSTFIRIAEENLPVPKEFLIRGQVVFGKDDADTLVVAGRRGEIRVREVLLRKQAPASKDHRSIDSVGLSPRGALWYVSTDMIGKELTYSLTVGDRVRGPFRSVPIFFFRAEDDAVAISFVPVSAGEARVELAGREIAKEPSVSELVVDQEFKRVAYVVVGGARKYWIAVDGKAISATFDWVGGVRFAPGGQSISYVAKSGNKLVNRTQSLN